jgi:ribosomal protein S18 acetylase RimI-like enzyme
MPPSPHARLKIERLMSGEEAQVVEFLNRQPLKNLQMLGFIRDNGLESERNRGAFYGCFDDGYLIGVALIGHWVLLSGNLPTVAIFARIARFLHRHQVGVVLGEEPLAVEFARVFSEASRQETHRSEAKLLLFINHLDEAAPELEGLRLAEAHEAHEVGLVHARACMELLGTNPLRHDTPEFCERVRARILLGRIWILRDAGGISFKTDIASETERAAYLEGVWTRPDLRGRGLGTRALRTLCRHLLRQHQVVCLLADAANARAVSFYQHVGFKTHAPYRLIRVAN